MGEGPNDECHGFVLAGRQAVDACSTKFEEVSYGSPHFRRPAAAWLPNSSEACRASVRLTIASSTAVPGLVGPLHQLLTHYICPYSPLLLFVSRCSVSRLALVVCTPLELAYVMAVLRNSKTVNARISDKTLRSAGLMAQAVP